MVDRQSWEEFAGVVDNTECGWGESASEEWLEWTDIDGDDESYTESGPDVVLSIIRSWKTCVVINCPRNAAGDVETSFLLYPDELMDEVTNILVGSLLFLCDDNFGEFLPTSPTKIMLMSFNKYKNRFLICLQFNFFLLFSVTFDGKQ